MDPSRPMHSPKTPPQARFASFLSPQVSLTALVLGALVVWVAPLAIGAWAGLGLGGLFAVFVGIVVFLAVLGSIV